MYYQRQLLNSLGLKGILSIALISFSSNKMRVSSQSSNLNVPEGITLQSWISESSNRMKSHHKMHKSRWTIITDTSGPRVCQATQTKRLCMKRRQEMSGKPIIIINFYGVLGWIE